MKYSYREYLEKTYAAWLGKVIGVRLGSPVESWTSEKIAHEYGQKEGYLVDYDIYASDDDTNGPLFFVRPLLEKTNLTPQDIGEAFLNYICEYHGFFWWGGVGVSTEHTAYENLARNIPAPASGSSHINGTAIAEQIGGQIFSDCWGYVAGGDPRKAARYAAMASSVTHDGSGIQGAVFVAACIALAYDSKDVISVMKQALTYLDSDLEYCKVAQDIMAYHEKHPDNYLDCLEYIQNNYGYDKYPGVCHIIPNSALMVMAMCYGDNDFSRTLTILNRSGWDTDCNCGNVGSIMGALVGLEGIDEAWITPINDIVNCSSCVGYLNMQTVSDSARMFTDLAFKLAKAETEPVAPFILPYAIKGIRTVDGTVKTVNGQLEVSSRNIYRYVYYLAEDLYDARYDPEFSPVIYPGDELEVMVYSDASQKMRVYAEDCHGRTYQSEEFPAKDEAVLRYRLPVGVNMCIHKVGILSESDYYILDYQVNRHPQMEYDFRNYPVDEYGPRYEGDYMSNIRGFVKHSGNWSIEDGLIGEGRLHALISTGAYGSRYEKISWKFIPEKGFQHQLVVNMKGFLHYDAVGFSRYGITVTRKDIREENVKTILFNWHSDREYELTLTGQDILIDGEFAGKHGLECLGDLYGFCLGEDCRNRTISLKVYNE